MLAYGRDRMAGFDNVELLETSGYDLREVPDESVDVVYCSVVFMHLDEWDRYNYVLEGRRILKPGGTLYVDNFDLATAWSFFEQHRRVPPESRPTQMSKSSTREELQLYFEHAGFDDIRVTAEDGWLMAVGTKSARPLPLEDAAVPGSGKGRMELSTNDNFDEAGYLAANPDIAAGVRDGTVVSGRTHFDAHGRSEGRMQWRRSTH
jgi:SAM-dependent methyltransferase